MDKLAVSLVYHVINEMKKAESKTWFGHSVTSLNLHGSVTTKSTCWIVRYKPLTIY